MPKFKIIITVLVTLFFSQEVRANVIKDLESRISMDKNIDFVDVSLNAPPKGFKHDSEDAYIEYVEYMVEEGNKFVAGISLDNKKFKISGKFDESSLIPAFKSYVQKGHIIEYGDLISVKVPNKKISNNLMSSVDKIIGRSARRKLPPNQPINVRDIETPNVIEKGVNVKMIFKKAGLSIESVGVAMEGGAIGDFIKIKNVDSGKIIKAKIIDEVTVSTNG